jgi:DHA1 family inner membrane transport protein
VNVSRLPAVVFAFGLCTFAIGTTEFVGIGLLPQIADGVSVSTTSAGTLISAYAIGVVIGAPLMIALGTRLPRRQLMLALMALFVAGNCASALAPSFGWLFAARTVTALPHGAVFGLAVVIAAQLVAPERRPAAVSATFLGLTLSTLAGAPLSTLVGQELGWRAAFWTVAALGALGLLALVVTMPAVPRAVGVTLRTEATVLLGRPVLVLLLITTIGFAGVFAAIGYLAPILHEEAGFSNASAVWGLAVFGLGSTAGNLLSPRILAHVTTVEQSNVFLTRVLTALVAALATFVMTSHVPALAVVNVFMIGAVGFMLVAILQGQLLDAGGRAPTLTSAAVHSAFNAGNALGPLAGGLAISGGLGYAAAPAAGAVLSTAGLLVAAQRRRRRQTDRTPSWGSAK